MWWNPRGLDLSIGKTGRQLRGAVPRGGQGRRAGGAAGQAVPRRHTGSWVLWSPTQVSFIGTRLCFLVGPPGSASLENAGSHTPLAPEAAHLLICFVSSWKSGVNNVMRHPVFRACLLIFSFLFLTHPAVERAGSFFVTGK